MAGGLSSLKHHDDNGIGGRISSLQEEIAAESQHPKYFHREYLVCCIYSDRRKDGKTEDPEGFYGRIP